MSINSHWTFGDSITLRGIGFNKLWWAYPAIVVKDIPDLVALYLPAGSVGRNTVTRPTAQDVISPNQLMMVDKEWTHTDLLILTIPDEAYSVYVMWETGYVNLDCWYINLQTPLQRSEIGFDTMDQMLDIVVSPDMSRWRWKDEDEFAEAERVGVYTPHESARIRSVGERAVQMLLSERRTFYKGWESWRPPLEWKIPELSTIWNEIFNH